MRLTNSGRGVKTTSLNFKDSCKAVLRQKAKQILALLYSHKFDSLSVLCTVRSHSTGAGRQIQQAEQCTKFVRQQSVPSCTVCVCYSSHFKTPLVSFYIYEYKGSAKAHIFPNVFFCSSPSCLDQACVPLYTLYCMQSCPSLQNLLHLQSEHTLRVYTSRLYISLYFDLHVCIAASDHEYIVSMHFIKLYKGEGNAPDVSDCCYETTGESVTKKKMFLLQQKL